VEDSGAPRPGLRRGVPASTVERQVLLQRSAYGAERYGGGGGGVLRAHAGPRVHHSTDLQYKLHEGLAKGMPQDSGNTRWFKKCSNNERERCYSVVVVYAVICVSRQTDRG